jgi:hypothetical protein
MNTSIASPPTPNLELLHKAVQEFRLNPRRVPFNNLKPFHDSIVELRGKKASYFVIAEILQQNGVKTSRARVAEYGRVVLDGGKSRKRRKRARTTPAVNTPAAPKSAQGVATKVVPAVMSNAPAAPTEDSPFRSRGPHIARVRMLDGTIAGEKSPGQTP